MAAIKFECRAGKVNSDGKAPLFLRITTGNKRAYISTGIYIPPRQWNHSQQQVRKFKTRLTNSDDLNEQLADLKLEAQKTINRLPGEADAAEIKSEIEKQAGQTPGNNEHNLLTIARSINEQIRKTSYNYYKRRRTAIRHFENFTDGRGILMDHISRKWIMDFYNYLITEKKHNLNSASKNIRVISQFYNEAIKQGLTEKRNPFELVKFKSEPVHKEKLSADEFKKIQQLQVKKESLIWHVRNYFCCQVYLAGMRISDLAMLQKNNYREGRVEYRMQKTGKIHSVIVTGPLKTMLQYYIESGPDRKNIFPMLDKDVDEYQNHRELTIDISRKTALCNKYLKKISKKADINKNLTTHIARHTFADMARKNGWSIYDISKGLGHSSLTLTEQYLAELDTESLDKEMQNMFS